MASSNVSPGVIKAGSFNLVAFSEYTIIAFEIFPYFRRKIRIQSEVINL